MVSLRALLDRLAPPRRDRAVEVDLPRLGDEVDVTAITSALVDAVADGTIAPSEAKAIGEVIDVHLRAVEQRAGALAGSDGYVFPSPLRKGPITRHAFSRAMSRVVKASGIADARLHDFRRTGSTKITGEKIRIPRFVVSRVLNQLGDTGGAAIVTAVYDRNEYLFEKRRALEAWASALAEVLTSNRSPQQVPPSSSHQ